MRTETLSFLIYLLSVGVLGLLGYQLYEKHDMRWVGIPGVGNPPAESLVNYRKNVVRNGSRRVASDRRWSYAARMATWWDVIKMANLTGKLPPPPKEEVTASESEEAAAVQTPQTPLHEILKIVTLFGSDTGTIKVQYKEGHGVQGPSALVMGLSDTVPGSGMSAGMAPGQTQAVLGPLYQDLSIGESLYPPFELIQVVRVEPVGNDIGVVFSRPAPGAEDAKAGKRVEEIVLVNQLEIGGDNSFAGLGTIDDGNTTRNESSGPKVSKGTWQDPGEKTRKIGNSIMISVKDQNFLSRPDEFLQEVAVQDFKEEWADPTSPGKKISVRGVAVTKISPRLRQFGVQEGEILIKINGTAVSGRSNAMNLGKQQYNRGVRSFDLTFLTSTGRERVISYQAPNK